MDRDAAEIAAVWVPVPAGTRTTVTYRMSTPRYPHLVRIPRCAATG